MEYIAVIVDDLLIFSRCPEGITKLLQDVYGYELKGLGIPEYYSGADIGYDQERNCWWMSAKTYIHSVSERIEKLLDVKLKNYASPMIQGDHPEIDETDLLYGTDISVYQMLMGCTQWAVTLCRFDIQYATNTLSRYNQMPRKGHYDRALRIFGYLKHNARATIYFDPQPPNLEEIKFTENDWKDLYPDAEEACPDDMPEPLTKKEICITIIEDASHATDLVTRRSVTGYLLMLRKAIIKWYSKRQNTVESSSYGAELVAKVCAGAEL